MYHKLVTEVEDQMSFFSHEGMPVIKEQPYKTALLPFTHQPYCWQVGLHQSLLPLEVDGTKIESSLQKKTHHKRLFKTNVWTDICVLQ